jgi:hypothetical protein
MQDIRKARKAAELKGRNAGHLRLLGQEQLRQRGGKPFVAGIARVAGFARTSVKVNE